MRMRLSRLHHPVTALGPGTRIGIWTQGCTIACPGCASRDTWPASADKEVDVSAVLDWCSATDPSSVDGITITGGEPSEQPEALTELLTGLDASRREHGWDVLCYTGVEYDEFTSRCPAATGLVDALVTGPYRAGEPTDLVWRGSANQRLIPIGERGHDRFDRWVDARTDRPQLQVHVDDDRVWLIGVPRPGDLSRLRRKLDGRGITVEDVSWRP